MKKSFLLISIACLGLAQCMKTGPYEGSGKIEILPTSAPGKLIWGAPDVYIPVTIVVTSKSQDALTGNQVDLPLAGAEVHVTFSISRSFAYSKPASTTGTGSSTYQCVSYIDSSTDSYPTFWLYQNSDGTNDEICTAAGVNPGVAANCKIEICKCDIRKAIPNIVKGERLTVKTDSRGVINLELQLPVNRKAGTIKGGTINIEAQSGNMRATPFTFQVDPCGTN